MIKKTKLFITLTLLSLLTIESAWADCTMSQGEEAAERYPVIIEATYSPPQKKWNLLGIFFDDSDLGTFHINTVFKGNYQKGDTISAHTGDAKSKYKKFREGETYFVIFIQGHNKELYTGACTPSFSYENINNLRELSGIYIPTLVASIENKPSSYSEKIKIYEKLIEKMPNIYQLHDAKALLHAENLKYDAAIATYKEGFKARHALSVKGIKDGGGNSIERSFPQAYEEIASSSTEIPMDGKWYMIGDRASLLLPYALILSKAERYDDALKVLDVAKGKIDRKEIEKMRLEIEGYQNGRTH